MSTRLQEIADEFTDLENNPVPVVAAPAPHPDCKAAHAPVANDRVAALAMLGKDRSRELFAMASTVKSGDPDYPLLRTTIKRMYMVCFGLDNDTAEAVTRSRV